MFLKLPDELTSLRQRIRDIMEEHVLPNEQTIVDEDRKGSWDTLRQLQATVRKEGLWAPHLPKEYGGRGLGVMGMCVLFREMGRSLVGPRVFNCDAPDQGNMDLLIRTASDSMKDRYLTPLCAAEITSAFAMTEPAPGAGADPGNLRTRAHQDGDDWVINGHKWYTTGGGKAAFLIVMARTSDDPREGATMFIVDRHQQGVEHIRDIDVMSEPLLAHREAELKFTDVRVSADAVLGGVGQGFRMAQMRLVPARLTHCMRWLGLADRAMDLCRNYLEERVSFGKPLWEHQLIQKMLADNATAIHAGNLMAFHCATLLEDGRDKEARTYSSMAKNHIAGLLCKVLDDAIQMHGGKGYSNDMPFAEWYRYARCSRIVDGPDEVHTMVIARDFIRRRVNLLV
jgi:acyl-CoA dehydrogenase